MTPGMCAIADDCARVAESGLGPPFKSPIWIFFTRPQFGPFFVLKFVRSRVFGRDFLQAFPKSLVTVKYFSNTKMAVNSR